MAAKENIKKGKLTLAFEALPKKTQKKIYIAVCAAAALVLLLLILNAADLLPHLDGSRNVVGGKLLLTDESELIVNLNTRDDPRYFSLGKVEIPEGYYDDKTLEFKVDKLTTDFTLRMNDKTDYPWFNYVAITACNESVEKRLENALSLTAVTDEEGNTTYSELYTVKSAKKGYELSGYIYGGEDKDEYSGRYNRYCLAYIPANRDNTCIMINLIASHERRAKLPTDEEMKTLLSELADMIEIK